jgi:hypothetical protein
VNEPGRLSIARFIQPTSKTLAQARGGLANQLGLENHAHDLDSRQRDGNLSKRFEAEHRPRQSLRSVVVLKNVVEIFRLALFDGGAPVAIEVFDCRGVGSALVGRVFSGVPAILDGLAQEAGSVFAVAAWPSARSPPCDLPCTRFDTNLPLAFDADAGFV